MSDNGVPNIAPLPEIAGHLVVYRTPDGQGLLCFRPEGAAGEDIVRLPFPGMVVGPLVQALTGQAPDLGAAGPVGLMRRMMRGG